MTAVLTVFIITIAYLAGSISSAILVCRAFSLPDPRTEGSKNPGATNVLRLAGKKYAAFVMLCDVLKGLLPVLLAKALGVSNAAIAFTCLAAVIGHMYPVFFQFKGGKGVATAIGALLGLYFLLGVAVIATWLLVANFTRYSSLASMVSMFMAPLYSLWMIHDISTFPPLFFIMMFIIYQHRKNITRLIDGTEPHFVFKRPVETEVTEPALSTKPEEKSKKKPGPKSTKKPSSKSTTTPAKKSTAKPVKKEKALIKPKAKKELSVKEKKPLSKNVKTKK